MTFFTLVGCTPQLDHLSVILFILYKIGIDPEIFRLNVCCLQFVELVQLSCLVSNPETFLEKNPSIEEEKYILLFSRFMQINGGHFISHISRLLFWKCICKIICLCGCCCSRCGTAR